MHDTYNIDILQLLKVSDYTLLGQYLLTMNYKSEFVKTCVNIPLIDDFSEYTKRLSKSLRQNYRTGINRLKREEKSLEFNVIIKQPIPRSLKKMFWNVYERRIKSKGINWNVFDSIFNHFFNPVEDYVSNGENNLNAYIMINGEVGAFLQAIINSDNTRCIVPRLAINDDFGLYCPGTILLWKTVEYLINETNIRNLDLSRGDEKYKYVMGGYNYYNNDYYLKCSE